MSNISVDTRKGYVALAIIAVGLITYNQPVSILLTWLDSKYRSGYITELRSKILTQLGRVANTDSHTLWTTPGMDQKWQ